MGYTKYDRRKKHIRELDEQAARILASQQAQQQGAGAQTESEGEAAGAGAGAECVAAGPVLLQVSEYGGTLPSCA